MKTPTQLDSMGVNRAEIQFCGGDWTCPNVARPPLGNQGPETLGDQQVPSLLLALSVKETPATELGGVRDGIATS